MATLTGEQLIALVTLIITTLGGGIGVAFKRWADAKVASQTIELKTEADKSKALADAQERLVNAAEKREFAANERAEKREAEANARTDRAIASTAQLTAAVGELSATLKLLGTGQTDMMTMQKQIQEELRKCSTAIDGFGRDLSRR